MSFRFIGQVPVARSLCSALNPSPIAASNCAERRTRRRFPLDDGHIQPPAQRMFGAQQLSDLLLRQPAVFAQGSQLQGGIPGMIGRLEAGAEIGIMEFVLQITIEVCLLSMQSVLLS